MFMMMILYFYDEDSVFQRRDFGDSYDDGSVISTTMILYFKGEHAVCVPRRHRSEFPRVFSCAPTRHHTEFQGVLTLSVVMG